MDIDLWQSHKDPNILCYSLRHKKADGFVLLSDINNSEDQKVLFHKMMQAFSFSYSKQELYIKNTDFVIIFSPVIANYVTTNNFNYQSWQEQRFTVGGAKLFIYPDIAEVGVSTHNKRLVWNQVSSYLNEL